MFAFGAITRTIPGQSDDFDLERGREEVEEDEPSPEPIVIPTNSEGKVFLKSVFSVLWCDFIYLRTNHTSVFLFQLF